jgi:hypothetical protein
MRVHSALIGLLMSLTPLCMDLMKWKGAAGTGAAGTGIYLFFGGLLMAFGAVGEVSPLPNPPISTDIAHSGSSEIHFPALFSVPLQLSG